MKIKSTIVLLFLLVIVGESLGQKGEPTVYKNLKTRKTYSISLNSYDNGDTTIYLINDKRVSKYNYNREMRKFDRDDAVDKCRPCILKYYDENGILTREGVNCTDCSVGWFKDYYPNGKVKLSGWSKENPTGDWKNIWGRGYCSIRDRQWVYFNEKGDTLYSEFWKEGEFIAQIPEQRKMEIWKVGLELNGEDASKLILKQDQLNDLIIIPKFKNSSRDSLNLSILFHGYSKKLRGITKDYTLEDFKQLDLNNLLTEKGYIKSDTLSYSIEILNNKKTISRSYLKIITDLPEIADSAMRSKLYYPSHLPKPAPEEIEFYLVNSMDTMKKIKLVPYRYYYLNYSENHIFDTLIESKNISLNGYLAKLKKTNVVFDISTEKINLKYKNGMSSTTTNDYWNYEGKDDKRTVNLSAITSFDYTSPTRDRCEDIGGVITGLSLLATLLVAPLVSIYYKTGDFNKNRYYTIAGGGLIGLSIGIPLSVYGSNSKSYKLTEKNLDKQKDLWYLESQVGK